ncbi:MAG: hypothetical protein IKN39_01040 [Clostridia bacterium]|nr:hypothetical protein [Clostridia bacterium]
MSLGFRKSLFGFNCDDVVAYIEKTHKNYTEKEIVLNEQIEDLKSESNSIKEQLLEVTKEKAEIEARLKEFTDKYEEMERLSKNIGKLYLVAKSNAEAIMKEANECADISRKEVQKNISSIDGAHSKLSSVKESIVNTSAQFARDIDTLTKSLDDARNTIENHNLEIVKSEEDYRELIKVLSNE